MSVSYSITLDMGDIKKIIEQLDEDSLFEVVQEILGNYSDVEKRLRYECWMDLY